MKSDTQKRNGRLTGTLYRETTNSGRGRRKRRWVAEITCHGHRYRFRTTVKRNANLWLKDKSSELKRLITTMKYYEIVRVTISDDIPYDWKTVGELVAEGRTRRALEYLTAWDNGPETLAEAISDGLVRDCGPQDQDYPEDVILNMRAVNSHGIRRTLYLCMSKSGFKEDYYLTAEMSELDLMKFMGEGDLRQEEY